MSEHLIHKEDALKNLLACSAYIAERLKSADGRADAMQHIVPLYIARGDVDTAAALADAVEDPLTRDRLLIAVADKCGEVGDYDYGLQLADAIEDFSMQSAARERVAMQRVAKGELRPALEIAESLDHPDEVLIAAATHAFAEKDRAESDSLLEKMQFSVSRCTAFRNFAAIALRGDDKELAVGMLERAATEASEIDFSEECIRALIDVAHNFIDVGRNDRAIAVFDEAKSEAEALQSVNREGFLASVSVGFLRAGSLDLADRTLDLVKDKTSLISALSGFAGEFSRKDEKTEALDAVNEAIAIIRSQQEKETRDHPTKFRQWHSLAVQLASLGEGEGGIDAALEIPDENERTAALAQLHVLFVGQGSSELADRSLSGIRDGLQKAFAVVGAADIDIREGLMEDAAARIGQALGFLDEIEQPVAKSSLMTECVRRYVTVGGNEKARECGLAGCKVISSILDDSILAASLAGLAEVYESAGFEASAEESDVLVRMVAKL